MFPQCPLPWVRLEDGGVQRCLKQVEPRADTCLQAGTERTGAPWDGGLLPWAPKATTYVSLALC